MLKNLNYQDKGIINCANKNSKANLNFQGKGDIDLQLIDGKKIEIKDVIYSKNLAKNLLSHRKFVDQGLQIFLDNKKINIYDPTNHKTIISGFYNKPFWEIELVLNQKGPHTNTNKSKGIFVNLATRRGEILQKPTKNSKKVKAKATPAFENKLLKTINNRKIEKADDLTAGKINGSIQLKSITKEKLNSILLWHARLGHMSPQYLFKFKKTLSGNKKL